MRLITEENNDKILFNHISVTSPGVLWWIPVQSGSLRASWGQTLPEDENDFHWSVLSCYLHKPEVTVAPPPAACLCVTPDLAVWDGIEELADLGWFLDVFLLGGQRVRWGQSINSKHPVDVAQDDEVFLPGNKHVLHQELRQTVSATINIQHREKAIPHSTLVRLRPHPDTRHTMQNLHSATSRSTSAEWQGFQTTAGIKKTCYTYKTNQNPSLNIEVPLQI